MTSTTNGISTEHPSNVADLLVQLGKIVLKNVQLNDWMDCETASDICRQHNIKCDGRFVTAQEVEALLRKLFQTQDEIYADCVNVVGYERRVGWDLVFQIRFYRHNPHWKASDPLSASHQAEDETAPEYKDDHDCSDEETASADPTEVSR